MGKHPELTQAQIDRIHREAEEMRARVMRGESIFDKPEKKQRPAPKPRKALVREGGEPAGPSGRRFDTEKIVEMYDGGQGMSSGQIAEELGTHYKTIVNHLKKAGVWNPANEGKGGRPKSDFCAEGHDQREHRRESSPGKGDWHCGTCKLKRNAEYKRAQAAKKRDNRVQTQPNGSHKLILRGEPVGTFEAEWDVAQALHEHLRWLSEPARARSLRGGR